MEKEEEKKIKVLKLKIYQPHAHYRIPFAFQRRHTYPIPPYSTVIGFLCNVLGIRNYKNEGEPEENGDYKELKRVKISICGTFESKTTEFVWFRNLNSEYHKERFGYVENRYINGQVEHPGGQLPVYIDVLNDVHLWIYISHDNEKFLERLKKEIKKEKESHSSRIYPLHIGRAEDWIVLEQVRIISIDDNKQEIYGSYKKFFWIPKEFYNEHQKKNSEKSGEVPLDLRETLLGLIYRLPTFYKLQNGYRVFEYKEVYLSEGEFDGTIKAYTDKDEDELPIFFCDMGGK